MLSMSIRMHDFDVVDRCGSCYWNSYGVASTTTTLTPILVLADLTVDKAIVMMHAPPLTMMMMTFDVLALVA